MNRELKFRVFDKRKKQWTHFDISDTVALSEDEVMQFTGLKDKNGKEIYEGDIVKLDMWIPKVYQVGFDRGGFCFYNEGDNYYNDAKYLENSEVIGNIYENKELLK